MKAPYEWHLNNFILGKDIPNAKDIKSGVRGAVASGKRNEDGEIEWEWNYEEDDVSRSNLLDFYVIPEVSKMERIVFPLSYDYQHLDPLPKEEKENPLMVFKEPPFPTIQEWRDLTAKAVRNMRKAEVDYLTIINFLDERKIYTTRST